MPSALRLLVCIASVACSQNVPRIRIANDDAHGPGSDGSATLPPGSDAMQELLNWAIQHSDPERVKELMQKYQERNLTIKDVYGQDVIDALFVNEGSVMQDMIVQISDFANASVADSDLEAALARLQEMIEQVDNAGNLHRMSGLKPLLELGCSGHVVSSHDGKVSRSESVRALALWTLGIAVQNNPPVQSDLMEIGGLDFLLGRLHLCSGTSSIKSDDFEEPAGNEYCSKLLFAVSGLVKNNETIQIAAGAQGLFDWLVDTGITHRLSNIAKKSMGLLDIALSQNPNLQFLSDLPAKQDTVATSLLAHVNHSEADTDAAEKALRLVNRLLSLRPMLFRSSFRSELSEAVASTIKKCELVHGTGDELCDGLGGLAKHADLALAARELSDDEL